MKRSSAAYVTAGTANQGAHSAYERDMQFIFAGGAAPADTPAAFATRMIADVASPLLFAPPAAVAALPPGSTPRIASMAPPPPLAFPQTATNLLLHRSLADHVAALARTSSLSAARRVLATVNTVTELAQDGVDAATNSAVLDALREFQVVEDLRAVAYELAAAPASRADSAVQSLIAKIIAAIEAAPAGAVAPAVSIDRLAGVVIPDGERI
jgi:hypothetical protein